MYRSICVLLAIALLSIQAECKTSYGDSCVSTGKSKASCKTKGASLASLCAVSLDKGELMCNSSCKQLKGQVAGKCGLFSCDCYKTIEECAEGNFTGQGQCGK